MLGRELSSTNMSVVGEITGLLLNSPTRGTSAGDPALLHTSLQSRAPPHPHPQSPLIPEACEFHQSFGQARRPSPKSWDPCLSTSLPHLPPPIGGGAAGTGTPQATCFQSGVWGDQHPKADRLIRRPLWRSRLGKRNGDFPFSKQLNYTVRGSGENSVLKLLFTAQPLSWRSASCVLSRDLREPCLSALAVSCL